MKYIIIARHSYLKLNSLYVCYILEIMYYMLLGKVKHYPYIFVLLPVACTTSVLPVECILYNVLTVYNIQCTLI